MKPTPEPPNGPVAVSHRIVRFELAPKTMIAVGLIVVAVWLLVRLVPVLLVLVAALMIVGTLNPVVAGLERRKCRRGFALGVVFGTALALAALAIFLTVPSLVSQMRTLVENEPEIRGRVVAFLEHTDLTRSLADGLRDLQYSELLKDSRAALLRASITAFEVMAYGVAAIFLALYIMVDRDRLRGAVFTLVPRAHHIRFSRVLLNLETIVGGYIRGQVITCALIGVFILALLLACHVPNALALAVLGGVLDVLPYLGVLLTFVPVVVAAAAVSPGTAVTVFVLLLLYEEFESRILIPVVFGRALRLPSSVVFLSLLTGGVLAGVVGALLALPIASALLMLLDELRVDLPGETEQPADIAVRQKDELEEREYEARSEAKPAAEASAIAVEIARERKVEEDGAAEQNSGKK